MKTVSITQVKRGLLELLEQGETVQVTNRGRQVATLRVFAEARPDRERAMEAARTIRAIGLKHKPSKKHGATRAVRELRDRGE